MHKEKDIVVSFTPDEIELVANLLFDYAHRMSFNTEIENVKMTKEILQKLEEAIFVDLEDFDS